MPHYDFQWLIWEDFANTVNVISQFWLLKINSIYEDDIFSIPMHPKDLPMIVRPKFWEKRNKTAEGNLNYGGYLCNKRFNYPAILNHHKK